MHQQHSALKGHQRNNEAPPLAACDRHNPNQDTLHKLSADGLFAEVSSLRLNSKVDWCSEETYALRYIPFMMGFRNGKVDEEYTTHEGRRNRWLVVLFAFGVIVQLIYNITVEPVVLFTGFKPLMGVVLAVNVMTAIVLVYVIACRMGKVYQGVNESLWTGRAIQYICAIVMISGSFAAAAQDAQKFYNCAVSPTKAYFKTISEEQEVIICRFEVSITFGAFATGYILLQKPTYRFALLGLLVGLFLQPVLLLVGRGLTPEGEENLYREIAVYRFLGNFYVSLTVIVARYIQEVLLRRNFKSLFMSAGRLRQLAKRRTISEDAVNHIVPPELRVRLLGSQKSIDLSPVATFVYAELANIDALFPTHIPKNRVRVVAPGDVLVPADDPFQDVGKASLSPTQGLAIVVQLEETLSALAPQFYLVRVAVCGDVYCGITNLFASAESVDHKDGDDSDEANGDNDPSLSYNRHSMRATSRAAECAVNALKFGIEAVRVTESLSAHGARLRVGVHTGPTIGAPAGGVHLHYAVYGESVKGAEALCGLGDTSQVVTSIATMELSGAATEVRYRAMPHKVVVVPSVSTEGGGGDGGYKTIECVSIIRVGQHSLSNAYEEEDPDVLSSAHPLPKPDDAAIPDGRSSARLRKKSNNASGGSRRGSMSSSVGRVNRPSFPAITCPTDPAITKLFGNRKAKEAAAAAAASTIEEGPVSPPLAFPTDDLIPQSKGAPDVVTGAQTTTPSRKGAGGESLPSPSNPRRFDPQDFSPQPSPYKRCGDEGRHQPQPSVNVGGVEDTLLNADLARSPSISSGASSAKELLGDMNRPGSQSSSPILGAQIGGSALSTKVQREANSSSLTVGNSADDSHIIRQGTKGASPNSFIFFPANEPLHFLIAAPITDTLAIVALKLELISFPCERRPIRCFGDDVRVPLETLKYSCQEEIFQMDHSSACAPILFFLCVFDVIKYILSIGVRRSRGQQNSNTVIGLAAVCAVIGCVATIITLVKSWKNLLGFIGKYSQTPEDIRRAEMVRRYENQSLPEWMKYFGEEMGEGHTYTEEVDEDTETHLYRSRYLRFLSIGIMAFFFIAHLAYALLSVSIISIGIELLIVGVYLPYTSLPSRIMVIVYPVLVVLSMAAYTYFAGLLPLTMVVICGVVSGVYCIAAELRERTSRSAFRKERISVEVGALLHKEELARSAVVRSTIPGPLYKWFVREYKRAGAQNQQRSVAGGSVVGGGRARSVVQHSANTSRVSSNLLPRSLANAPSPDWGAKIVHSVHPRCVVIAIRIDGMYDALNTILRKAAAAPPDDPITTEGTTSPSKSPTRQASTATRISSLMLSGMRDIEDALHAAYILSRGGGTHHPPNSGRALSEASSPRSLAAQSVISGSSSDGSGLSAPLSVTHVMGDTVTIVGPLSSTPLEDDLVSNDDQLPRITTLNAALQFLSTLHHGSSLKRRARYAAAVTHGALASAVTRSDYPRCQVFGAPVYVARALLHRAPRGEFVVTGSVAGPMEVIVRASPSFLNSPISLSSGASANPLVAGGILLGQEVGGGSQPPAVFAPTKVWSLPHVGRVRVRTLTFPSHPSPSSIRQPRTVAPEASPPH